MKDQLSPWLYKPLTYHLFSPFDVVFISLVDNYKFCQRVFDPNSEKFNESSSYQVITGIFDIETCSTEDQNCIQKIFAEGKVNDSLKDFVHITHFKVNNGLLIGNGQLMIHAVILKIKEQLKGAHFMIFKSFSWSEIVLIQFGQDFGVLQKNIVDIREYKLKHISQHYELGTLINQSLYHFFMGDGDFAEKERSIEDCNIFVDSHSYNGVEFGKFNAKYNENDCEYNQVNFKSSIELQVKPGHMGYLVQTLNSKKNLFDTNLVKFKNGKTDYLLKEVEYTKFISNYRINREMRLPHSELRYHIRKMKTNYLYEFEPKSISGSDFGFVDISTFLSKKYSIAVHKLRDNIRSLKISRHLREKIKKALSNYNNLIKDTVLYGEFIELRRFVEYLVEELNREVSQVAQSLKNPLKYTNGEVGRCDTVRDLELKITRLLEVFEDAFDNRVHNNYLYEEINEFSIDFNSAINQVNTIHDFLVKCTNNLLFPLSKDQIIVTQNDIDSKSNAVNVNYNVYHYLEPALIYTTLIKEVMNGFLFKAAVIDDDRKIKYLYHPDAFVGTRSRLLSELSGLLNDKQYTLLSKFDFHYFFTDIAKMSITYLYDYDLYWYWSWTYFLQDSNLYMVDGCVNDQLFQKELLRVCLIKNLLGNDADKVDFVKCPIPELFGHWLNHIENCELLSKNILQLNWLKESVSEFSGYIFRQLSDSINDRPPIHYWGGGCNHESEIGRANATDANRISVGIYTLVSKKNEQLDHASLWLQYISTLSRCMLVNYKENKRFIPELIREDQHIYLIMAVGHALLRSTQQSQSKIRLLARDMLKGTPKCEQVMHDSGTIFVDPTGGFFYNSALLRSERMQLINNIMEDLWDLAMRDKKRLFEA
ncbi:MAG: hypothetical protein IPL25_12390 [Saprospiraceae bacterium]|nr:hypothetical protein [Candidatus Vicinibacter affinis]